MNSTARQLLPAAACAVLGLVLILRPGLTASVLCAGLGICALIFAAVRLLDYFLHRGTASGGELAVGVALAAVGALCLASPRLVMSILPFLLGVVLIIDGAGKLSRSLELRKLGYTRWYLTLLLSACLLLVGVVMVLNPFGTVELAVGFFGLCLFLDGLLDILLLLRLR